MLVRSAFLLSVLVCSGADEEGAVEGIHRHVFRAKPSVLQQSSEGNSAIHTSRNSHQQSKSFIQTYTSTQRNASIQQSLQQDQVFQTSVHASAEAVALEKLQQELGKRSVQRGTTNLNLAFVVTIVGWDPHLQDYLEILRNSLARVAKPGSKYKTGIAKFVAFIPDHLAGFAECFYSLGFDDVMTTPGTDLCPEVDAAWHTLLYTRINLWNATKYDRIVSMDVDQVVLQNIDELFEYETFAAPHDWPRGALGEVAGKYQCACKSKMCKGKAPPMQGGYEWIKEDHYLNTGLLVIQPDPVEFKKMALALTDWNLKRFRDVYDPVSCQPSEQRFVGDFFDVNQNGEGWFPLPAEIYNVRLLLVQGAPQLLTSPKILHYAGFKPVDHKEKSEPIEEWYWQQWLERRAALNRTELPAKCKSPSQEEERLAVEPAERMGLMTLEQKENRTKKCGQPLFK